MKKLLSLLITMALMLSAFSVNAVLTGAADESHVLYYNNFDKTYEADEWNVVKAATDTVERIVDQTTGNGVLQLSTTAGPLAVKLDKDITNPFGQKPKLLFEYRFRSVVTGNNMYTFLGQDTSSYTDRSKHCHTIFNENKVYDKQGGTAIGSIAANSWNTISISYDNASNTRTVYINGQEGHEIEGGNGWYSDSRFHIYLTAQIRSTVAIQFDYIRIAACPDTFDYTASGSTGNTVDLTFNSLPDPEKMLPENFTVSGAAVSSVERNYEKPNTYTLKFAENLSGGSHTVQAHNLTSVDGIPVTAEAKSFTAVLEAPEYKHNYLYDYNFVAGENRSGFVTTPGDGSIEINEAEGFLRMTGVDGDPFVGTAVPQISKNQETVSGNPNVVLEFRYRTNGFNIETYRLQSQVMYGNSPGVYLYNSEVHTAAKTDTSKVGDAKNGEWHNVSIIYSGSKQERTILLDGQPMKTTTDGNGTAGTEYGRNQSNSIFAFQWRGYFSNTSYIDFDYIRAYTYPEFSMRLPKEERISTGRIDVDFSYFPDVNTLTNSNITVKEAGTENVVTTAGNPVSNGTVRQYNLEFAELLQPNTAYDVTLNVKDIDGRPLCITKPFTTGDPIMEIGALSIDKSNPSAVTASFTAENQTEEGKNGVLMLAAYTEENGVEKMVVMTSKPVAVAANSGKAAYTADSIDISALEGVVKLRAFLWSGDSNMIPLTEMREEIK